MNANDVVETPRHIAKKVVDYFSPKGKVLDPCAGSNAFYDFLSGDRYRCEIREGSDFFKTQDRFDWIISNPPYSSYDGFMAHAMEVGDNIVWVVPLTKTFKSKRLDNLIVEFGGLKEIIMLGSGSVIGFPFGYPSGCLHYQRGYNGDVKLTRRYEWAS